MCVSSWCHVQAMPGTDGPCNSRHGLLVLDFRRLVQSPDGTGPHFPVKYRVKTRTRDRLGRVDWTGGSRLRPTTPAVDSK
jgi:hypothetical protein